MRAFIIYNLFFRPLLAQKKNHSHGAGKVKSLCSSSRRGNSDEAEIGLDRTRRLFAEHPMAVNESVVVQQEVNCESDTRSDTESLKALGEILVRVKVVTVLKNVMRGTEN
ncbi:hypothetical protein F2P81_006217 [Scophthalmus maximus]|uniref:Uncharacterized protein n=1 Tax=Scophthalmus maximus TaxID=52904 RepID=A0A6A4T5X8_SCOMX|nr:hypothetical protein F2P81_006217 [Scophthalmus maximus]